MGIRGIKFSIAGLLAVLFGCQDGEFKSAAAAADPVSAISSEQIAVGFARARASYDFRALGRLTIGQWYDQALAQSSDRAVTVDGMTLREIRAGLIAQRSGFAALNVTYASLQDMWALNGIDPTKVEVSDFHNAIAMAQSMAAVQGSSALADEAQWPDPVGLELYTNTEPRTPACAKAHKNTVGTAVGSGAGYVAAAALAVFCFPCAAVALGATSAVVAASIGSAVQEAKTCGLQATIDTNVPVCNPAAAGTVCRME